MNMLYLYAEMCTVGNRMQQEIAVNNPEEVPFCKTLCVSVCTYVPGKDVKHAP